MSARYRIPAATDAYAKTGNHEEIPVIHKPSTQNVQRVDVFDEARSRINHALIEAELAAGASFWNKDEFWTLNPLRDDTRVGSFSINGATGMWKDFAGAGDTERGDLVDLISKRDGISKKEAAQYIIKRSGGSLPDQSLPQRPRRRPDAPRKPGQPFTKNAIARARRMPFEQWFVERWGRPIRGDLYRNANGAVVQIIVRAQPAEGRKNILPIYFDGSCVRMGQAFKHGRPVFNLDVITKHPDRIVLMVEGERARHVAELYLHDAGRNWVATCWIGGTAAVDRTDWTPLRDRYVVLWPDLDRPGMMAMAEIGRRLVSQGCAVCVVDPPAILGPSGDIADVELAGLSTATTMDTLDRAVPLEHAGLILSLAGVAR